MANEAYISAGINAGELTAANTAYVSAGIFPLNVTSGPTREINVFDGITVAEDKTIENLTLYGGCNDSTLLTEQVSSGISDLDSSAYDGVSVLEDIGMLQETFGEINFGLAKNNSEPYDWYSVDPAGTDPITVVVELSQVGGAVDTDVETMYLIAPIAFDMVTLIALSEDTGVAWKLSDDNVNWYDELTLLSVVQGATILYARATVANDGSIVTDQVSANIQVVGW